MRWLVCDSLSCPEQFFCSHLDSYSHYLREAGEYAQVICHNFDLPVGHVTWGYDTHDIAFVLDRYDYGARIPARKRIAQVAAICNPMPWDVRKPDGSPAYDCVISSIPWMVEQARAAGCRAEFMKLCFDHRALVCSMGVKKDIDCLFVGTVDGNHVKRARVLEELRDIVTVMPPVWGRDYYRLIARAKTLVHVGAEWARGARNALRLYEGSGLGALVISDGDQRAGEYDGPGECASTAEDIRKAVSGALNDEYALRSRAQETMMYTLAEETYIQRIPALIDLARSL